jgi:RND family efflux transporter MFP subunit
MQGETMKIKPQIIIVLFLILWIVFIVWGITKTTFRLSKQETPAEEPAELDKEERELPIVKAPFEKAPEQTMEKPPLEPTAQETPSISVRTFKAKRIDFSDLLPAMGTVKGKTEIELKFEINGVIQAIKFREGEKVKKDELIASLDPRDAQLKLIYAQNKLASAQAAYESSLKKLEIHQKLYQAGAIIKSKLEEIELESESAKYQLETVKTEVELAKNELKKTTLYSPMDGVMGPREAEEGEFITPQDKIASLLEINEVFVEIGIVERDINKIRLGQKAEVYVDAYPDKVFSGIISNIFPVVEGRSRTLTAKITVPNPDELLLPGMFCRAEIEIANLKDALIIPSTALIKAGEKMILVPVIPAQSIQIDEDEIKSGTVHLRNVSVGYITSDYAQIIEGLDEDDLAVLEVQGGELKDKAKVRIVEIEESIL